MKILVNGFHPCFNRLAAATSVTFLIVQIQTQPNPTPLSHCDESLEDVRERWQLHRFRNPETAQASLSVPPIEDQPGANESVREVEATELGPSISEPISFSTAFAPGFPRTVRMLIALGASSTDAEDLAQTIWLKAYRSWNTLREESRRNGWINRITNNEFCSARRGRRCEQLPEGYDVAVAPTVSPLMLAIEEALEKIDPWYRELFVLKYLSGKTAKEIAADLNKSEHVVYAGLVQAREALRQILEPSASVALPATAAPDEDEPELKIGPARAKKSHAPASSSRGDGPAAIREKTA
jgi:RNA polymerase sigma-70 factor (ECF subfamily)